MVCCLNGHSKISQFSCNSSTWKFDVLCKSNSESATSLNNTEAKLHIIKMCLDRLADPWWKLITVRPGRSYRDKAWEECDIFDWNYFGFTFVCVMDWSRLLLSAKNVADSRTKRVGFKVLKRFLLHLEAYNPAVKQLNPVVTAFGSDLQLLLTGGNTLSLAPMAMQCEDWSGACSKDQPNELSADAFHGECMKYFMFLCYFTGFLASLAVGTFIYELRTLPMFSSVVWWRCCNSSFLQSEMC